MVPPLHPRGWHRACVLMGACWVVQSAYWTGLLWEGGRTGVSRPQPPFTELPLPALSRDSLRVLFMAERRSVSVRPVTVGYSPLPGGGYHGCGAAGGQPVWLHQVQSGQQEEFNQHGYVVPWKAVFKTSKCSLDVRVIWMRSVTNAMMISNSCSV